MLASLIVVNVVLTQKAKKIAPPPISGGHRDHSAIRGGGRGTGALPVRVPRCEPCRTPPVREHALRSAYGNPLDRARKIKAGCVQWPRVRGVDKWVFRVVSRVYGGFS